MNIASYLEEALLDHVFRNNVLATEYTPTTIYCGIADNTATDDEMEDGDLTNEIDGYDGNRKVIEFTVPIQNVDDKAYIQNDDRIEFTEMPAVDVRYVFLADSATKGAGNILWWSRLDDDREINAGDICRIDTNELTITLD